MEMLVSHKKAAEILGISEVKFYNWVKLSYGGHKFNYITKDRKRFYDLEKINKVKTSEDNASKDGKREIVRTATHLETRLSSYFVKTYLMQQRGILFEFLSISEMAREFNSCIVSVTNIISRFNRNGIVKVIKPPRRHLKNRYEINIELLKDFMYRRKLKYLVEQYKI